MKKILIIRNVINSPTHLIAFAIETAKEMSAELHGIFLNESAKRDDFGYPYPNDIASTEVPLTEETIEEENTELINANIKLFQDECLASGIICKADSALSLDEVIELSSSSELIIAEANDPFPHFSIKDILTSAHCPVFVAATNTPVIENVILTFDGNETSNYAINKYKDIFPRFSHLPTFLITINFSPLKILEHKEYIYTTLPGYFSNLTVKEIRGDEKEELHSFLKLHDINTLIVMGAFGRSAVSRFFHPSLANTVLDEPGISLFNAHE